MKTKLKFVRSVTVDFYPHGIDEWQDYVFKKNDVLDLTGGQSDLYIAGNWADIVMPNGDLVESVPINSFIQIP